MNLRAWPSKGQIWVWRGWPGPGAHARPAAQSKDRLRGAKLRSDFTSSATFWAELRVDSGGQNQARRGAPGFDARALGRGTVAEPARHDARAGLGSAGEGPGGPGQHPIRVAGCFAERTCCSGSGAPRPKRGIAAVESLVERHSRCASDSARVERAALGRRFVALERCLGFFGDQRSRQTEAGSTVPRASGRSLSLSLSLSLARSLARSLASSLSLSLWWRGTGAHPAQ